MSGLIGAVIFGLIAGIIAKLLMPGKDPGGCIITSIIGIVGAMIGQAIGTYVFQTGNMDKWTLPSFALSVVGALVLLFAYRMLTKNKG